MKIDQTKVGLGLENKYYFFKECLSSFELYTCILIRTNVIEASINVISAQVLNPYLWSPVMNTNLLTTAEKNDPLNPAPDKVTPT